MKIIFKLLKQKDISTIKFANDLDVPYNIVLDWKSGQSKPNYNTLVKIAKYLKVTTAYLLQFGNNPHCKKNHIVKNQLALSLDDNANTTLLDRILKLFKCNKKNNYTLLNAIGLHHKSFTELKAGYSIPTVEDSMKIAKYFNASLDYLYGRLDTTNDMSDTTTNTNTNLNANVDMLLLDKIILQCNIKQINIAELEKRTNLSQGVIKNWDKCNPRSDSLARVAKELMVSTDYLLGLDINTAHLDELNNKNKSNTIERIKKLASGNK